MPDKSVNGANGECDGERFVIVARTIVTILAISKGIT
jgi:hypothetical protein